MSCNNGSSVISVALFLAILLIVLPVSAANATPTTTVTVAQNATAVPTTTVTVTQNATAVPTTTVTVTKNATAVPTTTVTATQTANATPVATTAAVTTLTTVVTTANLTVSETKTETTGSVMVYSSPAGASILIDTVYCGTTPRTVNDVPAGNHILRLTMSGYHDYEGSIYVVAGQTAQGYGTLQPLSQVTSGAQTPVPTAIVPVVIPVATATPQPTQEGLLGNTSVLTAIIGAIAVIIGSAATIFTHVRPPKKE